MRGYGGLWKWAGLFVAAFLLVAMAVAASTPKGEPGSALPADQMVQRGQAWWPYTTALPPYNGKLKTTESMQEEEIRVNDVAMVNITAPGAAYATMPADLLLKPGSQLNQKDGYYLVKIQGSTRTQEQIDALTHAGAVLGEFLHINTYIAKIASSDYGAVKGLPFVTAVLDYQPAYKISPLIGLSMVPRNMITDEATGAAQPWTFELVLHAGVDVNEVLSDLALISIYPEPNEIVTSIFDKNLTTIFVHTVPQGVPSLAKIAGVKYIIEHAYPKLMASSTQPTAIPMLLQNNGVYTTSTSGWKIWNAGIKGDASGTAQIVTMMDSGLAVSMYHFAQDTANVGTIGASHRKIVGYDNYGGDLCVLAYSNTVDGGHGTWTSQHAVGSISNMTSNTDTTHTPNVNYDNGGAPNGKVYFQDVGLSTGSLSTPTDLGPSIVAAIGKGSYVQNLSWGTTSDSYDTQTGDLDAALYANPSMLETIAAGNNGVTGTSNIGTPSTAKNAICVGGVDASQPNNVFEDCSWDGTAACASTDAGSSRGPGPSSRTKPDILAYFYNSGTMGNETAMAGDQPHAECETSPIATYWDFNNAVTSGGTSFAAPDVAGQALLIRDYFVAGYYPTGAKVPANTLTPTGSLVKAMILASGEPMATTAWPSTTCTGCAAIGARPSSDQGWGRIDVPAVMHIGSGAPYLWVKNNTPLANGAYDTWNFTINSNTTPLRVMLVWYDKTGSALVDNLDLAVTVGANTYLGNHFTSGWSSTGGSADATNPQEGVFLNAAAGLPSSGTFSVKVTATSSPDAVPYSLVVVGDITGSSTPYANMSQATYICHGQVNGTIIDAGGAPTNAFFHSTSGAIYPGVISGGPGTYTVTGATTDQLGAVSGDNIWLTFTGDDSNPYASANALLKCALNVCASGIDPLTGGCDNDTYLDDGETLAFNVTLTNSELFDTPTPVSADLVVDPSNFDPNILIVNGTATWDVIPGGGTTYASGTPFQVRYTANGGGPILTHFKVTNIHGTDNSWTGNGACAANSFTEYANTNNLAGTTYVSETFDGTTFPPTDSTTWTQTANVTGTGSWARVTALTHPTKTPYAGAGMAYFNSYNFAAGTQARLQTGVIDMSSSTLPSVSFYMLHDLTYTNDDTVTVQAATAPTGPWTTLQTFHRLTSGTTAGVWINHVIPMTAYAGNSTVYVGFLGTSAYGENMAIDSVTVANLTRVNDGQTCVGTPAVAYNDGDWNFDDSQCNNLSDWTNNVGSPDAGESGSLLLYLANTGNENAYGVTATLACPSCPAGVTVCKGTATYGTVPYGTAFVYGAGDDGFRIAIGSSVAAMTPMPFVLTVSGTNISTTVYNTVTATPSAFNTIVGTPTIQGSCTSPYAATTGTTTDVAYDNFQVTASSTSATGRCGFTTGWTTSGTVTTNTTSATPTGDTRSASISGSSSSTGYIWKKFDTTGMDYDVEMHCFVYLISNTTATFYWDYTPDGTTFYNLGSVPGTGSSSSVGWGNLGPFSIWYQIYSSPVAAGFGPAAANAILNNPNFGIRFRVQNTSGTARAFLIDDVEVDMYTHVNKATTCSGVCAVPDTPSLDSIVDVSPCVQNGIKVFCTGSLGTTSFDLLKDGNPVVIGYVSGTTYDPTDSASHTYVIRAVNSDGTANSAGVAFIDHAGTITPTISIGGSTLNTQTGYTGYQWYKDAVAIGGANSASYTPLNPADCGFHTYTVTYTTGACTTLSAGTGFTVSCGGSTPKPVPYSVSPNSITTATNGTNGTITWDVTNCASTNYHILYGKGENLATWTVDGGKCAIGNGGTYNWTGIPDPTTYTSKFLWFLIVGDDGSSTEGSWGLDSSSAQEGAGASGVCGMSTRDLTGVCGTP